MREGGVLQFGVDLFDDRVPAMDPICIDGVDFGRIGGGEERVESPHVEQLPLALILLRSLVRDPPHDQPAWNVVGLLLGGERGERYLGDLGDRDPLLGGVVVDRVGVADGRPCVVGDGGDRSSDDGVEAGGDRDVRAPADRCPDRRYPK
ncbi:hypothetical protein BJF84_17150 [Rhodococcus sp. CUA-806]|nr:hypothetical protein BJF84_17150 [Rhodococcus sp. CUA-806]